MGNLRPHAPPSGIPAFSSSPASGAGANHIGKCRSNDQSWCRLIRLPNVSSKTASMPRSPSSRALRRTQPPWPEAARHHAGSHRCGVIDRPTIELPYTRNDAGFGGSGLAVRGEEGAGAGSASRSTSAGASAASSPQNITRFTGTHETIRRTAGRRSSGPLDAAALARRAGPACPPGWLARVQSLRLVKNGPEGPPWLP